MAVSILDVLMNAEQNLKSPIVGLSIAREQLHNAIVLLGKGYSPYEPVEPLLKGHGTVEDVPVKPPRD